MNRYYRHAKVVFVLLLGCLLIPASGFGEESQETPKSPIIEERPETEEEAIDLFTQKFVWAEDQTHVGVNQYGQEVSRSHHTQFYQGRYKRPLDGVEFYNTVKRPDLADEYRSGSRRRSRLVWGGLGGMVAGPMVAVGGGYLLLFPPGESESLGKGLGGSLLVLGTVATLVGPFVMLMGSMINPHPIEPHEARQIVESYNLRLIDELELDEDALPDGDELPEEDDGSGPGDFRADIMVGGDGEVGVGVGFRF